MNIFYKVLIFILSISKFYAQNRKLVLLHTISRHGERSPCYSFDNDPYKLMWKQGLCQLTKNGEKMLIDLGKELREEYSEIIPEIYNKKRVYVRSSDTDRTIMSGLSAMKGLFPNQVIPIHSVPKLLDYQLKMTSHCPTHYSLLMKEYNKEKYQNIFQNYDILINTIEELTDKQNIDIHEAMQFCDTVLVWKMMNLTLPKWCDPDLVVKPCKKLKDLKFVVGYSNMNLTKYRGGPLMEMLLDNMITKVDKLSRRQHGMDYYAYFTHDSTISALLSHLQAFNKVIPPLASTVIFELYQYVYSERHTPSLNDFSILIRYKNNSHLPAHPIYLLFCGGNFELSPYKDVYECSLHHLIKHFSGSFIRNLRKDCGIDNFETIVSKASGFSLNLNDQSRKTIKGKPIFASNTPDKKVDDYLNIPTLMVLEGLFVCLLLRYVRTRYIMTFILVFGIFCFYFLF